MTSRFVISGNTTFGPATNDGTNYTYSFQGKTSTITADGLNTGDAAIFQMKIAGVTKNRIYSDNAGNLVFDNGTTQHGAKTSAGAWTLPLIHNIGAGNITSGTYTPTITNGTNIASTATQICMYSRVGDVVTVHFNITVATTAAGNTASDFEMTLPIASNIALGTDICGSGSRNAASGTASGAVLVSANATTDRAFVLFNSTVTTSTSIIGSFGYLIK